MAHLDPYRIPAGPELDALVHQWLCGSAGSIPSPAYSTEDNLARKVELRLRQVATADVVTGKARMRVRRWFARYETDPSTGTEVLADTYALAVCRLALLWIWKNDRTY
ncbi:MAG: hypothetical protein ACYDH9_18945 [Limisphaerales bacterium]